MEAIERKGQFGDDRVPIATVDSADALGDAALAPPALGLYSEAQYRQGRLPVRRFSSSEPLRWVVARRLIDQAEVLVPLEAVHPYAVPHRPLVLETSSGTAAAATTDRAIAAALAEVIERDAALRWWYRRPTAARLDISQFADAAAQVDRLAARGFVLVIRLLPSVPGLPVVLIVALRGPAAAIGLGCAPKLEHALAHALRELGVRLRWLVTYADRRVLHLATSAVMSGADHVALYDRGPLHFALREALDDTTGNHVVSSSEVDSAGEDELATAEAVAAAGFEPLVAMLPTPDDAKVHVARVLVPGMVPFWVGAARERLGCRRLSHRSRDGTLVTLLPHPFG